MLHVQSISAWAPACIGPYAQAACGGRVLHLAGQIGLDPASMQLVQGGAAAQVCIIIAHYGRGYKFAAVATCASMYLTG